MKFSIDLPIEDAIFLNSIYKGRYPTEEGLLPHGDPSNEDAKKAIEAAKGLMTSARKYVYE